MSARDLAYKILLDIEKNNNYSNLSINSHLRTSGLDEKDKGFVTELVYGVIENRIFIDYLINSVSKIKVKKMLYAVRITIRMGVYQLIFLDGVADYAAINESVAMIKKRDKKSSNFVNAILRNILRQKDDLLNIDENSVDGLAIKYSFEKWILDRFVNEFGFDNTKQLVKSLSEKPNIYVRVNRLKASEFSSFDELVQYVINEFEKIGVNAERVDNIEEALVVHNFKNIENNRMFKDGYISVQDISSMLVGKVVLGEKAAEFGRKGVVNYSTVKLEGEFTEDSEIKYTGDGIKILDLCAAPGGKSMHLCELLNNTGKVLSTDLYEHKVTLISNYAKRLGVKNVEVRVADAKVVNNDFIEKFDYVLCDVPCSGMGIVRRKPEIKYKKESEVDGIELIQAEILEVAAKYVKKGGNLIYSTCTIFREEDEKIVEEFLEQNKEFELCKIELKGFSEDRCKKGMIKVLPNVDNMDGFFISKMKKS